MSSDLSKPVTWLSVMRVGLLWGAEYGVLSLIEDSTFAVKAATIFCAISALAALEFRSWLDTRRKNTFLGSIALVSLVWTYFILGGINNHFQDERVRRNLRNLYLMSSAFIVKARAISDVDSPSPNMVADKQELKRKIVDWENRTSQWIETNIGPVERERFLDDTFMPNLAWSNDNDQKFSALVDRLVAERRNLAELTNSPTYQR